MKTVYQSHLKNQVKFDRQRGMSLDLLARKYQVPKTTIYYWIKKIPLTDDVRSQLRANSDLGRVKGRKLMAQRTSRNLEIIKTRADSIISNLNIDKNLAKVLCASLYWAEGSKNTTNLGFINSDPAMIQTFLTLFRKAYEPDETKFRVLIHLHNYHNIEEIHAFWSRITRIPLTQFSKPFQKPNSGKSKKAGYKGCVHVRYYDAKIAKELYWLYTTLHLKIASSRGVG